MKQTRRGEVRRGFATETQRTQRKAEGQRGREEFIHSGSSLPLSALCPLCLCGEYCLSSPPCPVPRFRATKLFAPGRGGGYGSRIVPPPSLPAAAEVLPMRRLHRRSFLKSTLATAATVTIAGTKSSA